MAVALCLFGSGVFMLLLALAVGKLLSKCSGCGLEEDEIR